MWYKLWSAILDPDQHVKSEAELSTLLDRLIKMNVLVVTSLNASVWRIAVGRYAQV